MSAAENVPGIGRRFCYYRLASGLQSAFVANKADAMAQIKGVIALKIDADKVPSGAFFRVAAAFVGLVKEVASTMNGKVSGDLWNVSAGEGAVVINMHPDSAKAPTAFADQVVADVLRGISVLENEAENPFQDNDKAIEHIQVLGKIANRNEGGIPLALLSRSAMANISVNVYNHASQLLSWNYEDAGTVDGVLDAVSARNGYEFRVSEILSGKSIKCIVSESMLEKALRSIKQRVEVEGLIRYNKDGSAKSVKAYNIVAFPPPEAIPHFSTLKGILKAAG